MMPENESFTTIHSTDLASAWGVDLRPAVCEHCDWGYLLPQAEALPPCPHCFQETLTWLEDGLEHLPYTRPPELCLPFTLSQTVLRQRLEDFSRQIRFAPFDLTLQNLIARLQQVYLPRWLVDSEVQGVWQAEVGFNYDVVSYQDSYDQNRNGWVSREVTETRIRWEPRVGRLRRTYHNIAAPALEEDQALKRRLGDYDAKTSHAYRPQELANVLVRLPNRSANDAWPEITPHFQVMAAEECRHAAEADHIREFRWSVEYLNQNWTQLLLPLYTTYYLDDDQNPQLILIHGQSGRLSGARRASMKQAKRVSFFIAAAAGLMFLCSLIGALAALFERQVWPVVGWGLLLTMVVAVSAIVPVAIAWEFNRSQELE